MKLRFYTPIILLSLLLIQACAPKGNNGLDKYNRAQLLTDIYDKGIEPLHVQFKAEAAKLDSVTQIFAQTPTLPNLNLLQQQWLATQYAWQICAPIYAGEIKESLIHNTINRWPSNTQFIENFIAGTDALNEAFIEGKGSSSKGLPAMEYLIFGDNNTVLQSLTTGANAQQRMQYLQALSANLKTKGGALLTLWQSYRADFVNQTGLAIDGSVSMLVNSLIEYQELIKNAKVGEPAGKKNGIVNGEMVESARSNSSLQHIVRNLQGISVLMNGDTTGTGSTGLYVYIDAVDPMVEGQKLSDKIKTQIQICINAATAINQPLEDAITNNPAQVDTLYLELKKLTVLLKVDMTSILGVTVTFSDNDGD